MRTPPFHPDQRPDLSKEGKKQRFSERPQGNGEVGGGNKKNRGGQMKKVTKRIFCLIGKKGEGARRGNREK